MGQPRRPLPKLHVLTLGQYPPRLRAAATRPTPLEVSMPGFDRIPRDLHATVCLCVCVCVRGSQNLFDVLLSVFTRFSSRAADVHRAKEALVITPSTARAALAPRAGHTGTCLFPAS